MASTHDRIQFLRARYDEEAAVAEDATAGTWQVTEYVAGSDYGFDAGIGTAPGEVDVVGHGYEGGGCARVQDARHIALYSPAHVLLQVAAKRRVLDAWDDIDYDVPDYVIDAFAEAYSDHPDYPK